MPQPLELHPATPTDIPALIETWYASFTDETIRHFWPNTPPIHDWWTNAHTTDMTTKPFQKYLKVIDPSATERGQARIVAWAKWDLSMPAERGRRFPAWHAEQPGAETEAFFGKMEKARERVMGGRKNYYLDMLCTHPEYRRRGAGAMLVGWGCERADADGVAAYVDASAEGKGLYEKFGFVDYSAEGDVVAAMGRIVS